MSVLDHPGGALCLDLANTWGDRSDPTDDTMHAYEDLLSWANDVGVVDDGVRRSLERSLRRSRTAATEVYDSAIALREAVYRIASTVAAGGKPDPADVDTLNQALETVPRQRLCCGGECCEWEWPVEKPDLRQVLWPVILSASELLTSEDAGRIRECAAPDCNWLFLDRSRGARRRWCDMSICGNRAKARRYYERHHRNI